MGRTGLTSLFGRSQLNVHTDHSAFRWILNLADAAGTLARWSLRLFKFEFVVVLRPGINHQAADTLSPFESDGFEETPVYEYILCRP